MWLRGPSSIWTLSTSLALYCSIIILIPWVHKIQLNETTPTEKQEKTKIRATVWIRDPQGAHTHTHTPDKHTATLLTHTNTPPGLQAGCLGRQSVAEQQSWGLSFLPAGVVYIHWTVLTVCSCGCYRASWAAAPREPCCGADHIFPSHTWKEIGCESLSCPPAPLELLHCGFVLAVHVGLTSHIIGWLAVTLLVSLTLLASAGVVQCHI